MGNKSSQHLLLIKKKKSQDMATPNLQQLVTAEEAAVKVLLKIRELIDAIEHAADLAEAAGYGATATTLRQEAQNLQPRLTAAQANLDTARAAIQDYWDTDDMNC